MLDTMTDVELSESDDLTSAANEARLVEEAGKGNRQAFGELVTR